MQVTTVQGPASFKEYLSVELSLEAALGPYQKSVAFYIGNS